MKEYFIALGLSLFIIFFTFISFASATKNTNAWDKFTFRKQRLVNLCIGIVFAISITTTYLINIEAKTILFYIVAAQFAVMTGYVFVLNIIATGKKKKIIEKHLAIISEKYPDMHNIHDIVKACILDFDIVYTHQEIETVLKVQSKKIQNNHSKTN